MYMLRDSWTFGKGLNSNVEEPQNDRVNLHCTKLGFECNFYKC